MKNTLRVREILMRLIALAVFVIFAVVLNIRVYGADFNAAVSSGEFVQGEDVTVTVTMSSDVTVGAYDLALTYDANVLEYVSGADGGGGGSLRLYNDSDYTTAYTVTIKFKAKAAGSTNISIVKQGDICDIDLNDLTLKATDGTVTVTAPVTASSNANLSSLSLAAVRADGWSGSVTLMPEFTKDVTEYQLWLGSEFTKLSVSASAEDAKAKISTSGTDLKAGQDNIATITVTAEDGTVKTYTITVHVKAEENTTESGNNATEAPTEVSTETPTEAPTEAPTDSENPDMTDNRNVTISDKSYTVLDITEELELPEGFERITVSWNGIEIMGASDQSRILTLLYLQNNESGESGLYIYDSEKSSYTIFLAYTITQRAYVMLMADEDLIFAGKNAMESDKLELTTLNIAGGYVDAYKLKNAEDIYIVKAMNWDNIIGYYYYNAKEGSMLPYFETVEQSSGTQVVQASTASAEKSDISTVICFVLSIVSIILIIIIIVLAVNVRKLSGSIEKNDNEVDEADEDNVEGEADEITEAGNTEPIEGTEYEKDAISPDIDIEAVVSATNDDVSTISDEIYADEKEAGEAQAQEEPDIVKDEELQAEVLRAEAVPDVAEAEKLQEEEISDVAEAEKLQEEEVSDVAEAEKLQEEEISDVAEAEKLQEEEVSDVTEAEKLQEEEVSDVTEAEKLQAEAATDMAEAESLQMSEESEEKEATEPEAAKENITEPEEENMSEQELDSAIDDILGQLFK